MKDERWRRVEELFLAAAERPPGERSAFLDRSAAGEETLRDEVESLLTADRGADRVLAPLREEIARDLSSLEDGNVDAGSRTERAGERLGPYVLDELLGRGGMGAVYRAHRADRTYEAEVAVKILPAEALGEDAAARFDRERRILAGLDHPNIARLLDAGSTAAGEPYFVMEHVDGEALDVDCEERRLSVDERLRLFLLICRAVEQAHRSLVVHRDLKPANVRVTPDGVPKLLDFGIAKLLDDASSEHADLTRTSDRPMTPSHASPEQIEGGPITTATDVYGLGVLLYQILTGRLPYPDGGSLHRAIVERDPPPPSAVCPEESVRRRLRGDLDTIVLKALEKDPGRRYGSAAALADDLERHLRGFPIEARRPTLRYRVAKLVRRHRLGVAAATAAALAVLGLSAALAFLAVRLAGERDRARAEQRKAEEVVTLMVDLLSAPDPATARGDEITAREVLDRGAERLDERLRDQPGVRAALLDAIGEVYHGLGLYEPAVSVLSEAFELRRDGLGAEHPATGETLRHLAAATQKTGDFAGAERLYRRALEIETRVRGPERLVVADLLDSLSELERRKGEYGASERLLRRALAVREAAAPDDVLGRSTTLFRLAQILHEKERLAEAEELFRRVLAIQEPELGADHPDTLAVLEGLGDVLRRRGRGAEAEQIFRRLLELQKKVFGARHPRLAYAHTGVGLSLIAQDRLAEGIDHLERALEIRQELLGEDHPAVMVTLNNLADALRRHGELEKAEALHRRSLEGSRRLFPPGFTGLAYPLTGLGEVLLDRGRPTEAEPLLREALELRRDALGPDNLLTAVSRAMLAVCLMERGGLDEAGRLLDEARAVMERSEAPVPPGARRTIEEGTRRLERLRGGEERGEERSAGRARTPTRPTGN